MKSPSSVSDALVIDDNGSLGSFPEDFDSMSVDDEEAEPQVHYESGMRGRMLRIHNLMLVYV
jgi:hypothetical protein